MTALPRGPESDRVRQAPATRGAARGPRRLLLLAGLELALDDGLEFAGVLREVADTLCQLLIGHCVLRRATAGQRYEGEGGGGTRCGMAVGDGGRLVLLCGAVLMSFAGSRFLCWWCCVLCSTFLCLARVGWRVWGLFTAGVRLPCFVSCLLCCGCACVP